MVKADMTGLDLKSDKVVLQGDEASKNTAPIVDSGTFHDHHRGATQGKEVIPESGPTANSPTWLIAVVAAIILLIIAAALYWRKSNGKPQPGNKPEDS